MRWKSISRACRSCSFVWIIFSVQLKSLSKVSFKNTCVVKRRCNQFVRVCSGTCTPHWKLSYLQLQPIDLNGQPSHFTCRELFRIVRRTTSTKRNSKKANRSRNNWLWTKRRGINAFITFASRNGATTFVVRGQLTTTKSCPSNPRSVRYCYGRDSIRWLSNDQPCGVPGWN